MSFLRSEDKMAGSGEENNLMEKAVSDYHAARQRFEIYERFYASLSEKAKQYLRRESSEYRRCLKEVRGLIRPGVGMICPTCETPCCRLFAPELSIYMAGTVGGFELKDYLLAKCDDALPDPCHENAAKNLCPFWDVGCVLPVDRRSFLCIQFFCDKLRKELEMGPVLKALEKIQTVVDRFSIAGCMA